ncbi:hypothetical protein LCY76_07310 [Fictibacillus sp. KIGAM418]|uniref:Glucose/Sorbosone dehydrogenase domain-containing protein n=1 Tax=Fictibacillus marinisediminis TaxID=2878389 RepID=A0A9X1X8Z8_9BACL|nr:hypothetical protein [Fictibacillus marinisediminis]MCK6256402.1 hypothetical protein [Fictibacillus marinisediminis]
MDREGTTNPGDIALKEGYRIEAAVKGLQHPIKVEVFAINRSGVAASATGGRGLEQPKDVAFGPDGSLYVSDFGTFPPMGPDAPKRSGMIWRIFKV